MGGALPCKRLGHLSQSCLPLPILPFFLCSLNPSLPLNFQGCILSVDRPPKQVGVFWGLGKVLGMRGAEAPEDSGGPGLRGREGEDRDHGS